MGYRGFIQLAQRSGQIRNINCDVIYKEEFLRYDKVYGTLHLTDEQVDSGEVIGYFASLELINGFRKMIFWKKEKVIEHARKYSKTYDKQAGDFKPGTPWSTEFDAMAQKTLIKTLLRNYAPLSIELQEAIKLDDTDSNVNEVKKAKDVTPYNETSGQDILDKMTSKAIVEDTTEDTAISETETPNVTVDAETGEILDEEEPF